MSHLASGMLAALLAVVMAALPDATTAQTAARGVAVKDWPQWGGPRRNFTSTSTGLAATWPRVGPRRHWARPLGEGHSGIVIEAGRLYTMYRRASREHVIALDAASGRTVWDTGFDAPLSANMDTAYGVGPHATPLLTGSLVCAVGATAKLVCLEKQSGKLVWQHDLWQEYGGTVLQIGYSGSPLAYRDTIIVQIGGEGHSVMAFAGDTGVVRWRAQSFRNSNSSPILARVGDQDQVVVLMHREVAGLDPANGRLIWSHAATEATDWNFHFNISTPLWGADGLLFVSAAYGLGSRVFRLTNDGERTSVTPLWHSARMRVHHENAIRIGDVVYGANGHLGPAPYSAVEIETGKLLWQDRTFSHATALHADGRLILLDEDGLLGLASPSPRGLTVHARTQLFDGRSWTVPTLVGTTLFARDRKTIVALELGR